MIASARAGSTVPVSSCLLVGGGERGEDEGRRGRRLLGDGTFVAPEVTEVRTRQQRSAGQPPAWVMALQQPAGHCSAAVPPLDLQHPDLEPVPGPCGFRETEALTGDLCHARRWSGYRGPGRYQGTGRADISLTETVTSPAQPSHPATRVHTSHAGHWQH